MVELSLEEVMELKSNRKLPPWRPGVCLRGAEHRAQGLARLSARGRRRSRRVCPEPLCPLMLEVPLGAGQSTVCAQELRGWQAQERLKSIPARWCGEAAQASVDPGQLPWWGDPGGGGAPEH